tara:strand:+ start:439 stop:930 length:492 start_codon:yes stop_codon:yes gene_type:complete
MEELQSGQKVTVKGVPLISSLTISCQIIIWIGYALAVLFISTATTGSFGFNHLSAFENSTKEGLSIEGMPSFGGPPERISEKSIEDFSKLVFFHSDFQSNGSAPEVCKNLIEINPIKTINNDEKIKVFQELNIFHAIPKRYFKNIRLLIIAHVLQGRTRKSYK